MIFDKVLEMSYDFFFQVPKQARFYEFALNELFGKLSEPSRAFLPKARAKTEPKRAEPRLGYNTSTQGP